MSKTLVIILSETRAHELTFNSFKKNVIDELNADLCLCIGVKKDYDYNNPFYKLAKYHFLYDEENDKNFVKSIDYSYSNTNLLNKYEKINNKNCYQGFNSDLTNDNNVELLGEFKNENEIDISQFNDKNSYIYLKNENKLYSIKNNDINYLSDDNNIISYIKRKHYSEFLNIKNRLSNENNDNFVISTYIHVFFLWFLQFNLEKYDLMNQYDRFIITRSDFKYELPIPKMDLLDEKSIWIPNGEDYSGLCDRFVVLSKYNIKNSINILENFYIKSNLYFNIISKKQINSINMELIFKINLEENKVINNVKRFPYVMYCVRNINGISRWSQGIFSQELGYFIKYNTEYEQALNYKKELEKYENINNFYNYFIDLINR